jgi:ankyrin repeat protein
MVLSTFFCESIIFTSQTSDSGNCKAVELLLSRGAYVDPFCTEHGTPLHVAAQHKQDSAMKILLDHHADVRSIICFFIVFLQLYLLITSVLLLSPFYFYTQPRC